MRDESENENALKLIIITRVNSLGARADARGTVPSSQTQQRAAV
jgi:hypothetical protein